MRLTSPRRQVSIARLLLDSLGLPAVLLRNSLRYLGHIDGELSLIQQYALPIFAQGHDMIICAKDGAGKSLACLIAVINRLSTAAVLGEQRIPAPTVLIVLPTPELVRATHDVAQHLCAGTDIVSCFATVGITKRAMGDILLSMPGQLMGLVARGALSVASIQVLVVEECDEIVSKYLADHLRKLRKYLPQTVQILLTASTSSMAVSELAKHLMRPHHVRLALGIAHLRKIP